VIGHFSRVASASRRRGRHVGPRPITGRSASVAIGYAGERRSDEIMTECKHGLKSGCVYCHVTAPQNGARTTTRVQAPAPKRQSRSSRLSEQMNDRMTILKQQLKKLRGQ
jgi:hypothetical protein